MFDLSCLVVDDEKDLRASLISVLDAELPEVFLRIDEAHDGHQAIEKVYRENWDLVLMDVRMPHLNGLEALKRIKEHDPRIFVVMMTAHGNVPDAITAIKEGAYDYLEKPIDCPRLIEIVRQSIKAREMVSNLAMSRPILDDDIETELMTSSNQMREVFNLITRLSRVETPVLVRGENGTGKELVARAIHFNSPRKKGHFNVVNCQSLPEDDLERELFGSEKGGSHVRRIGLVQMANQGTLLFDEIASLSLDLQTKVLNLIENQAFRPIGGQRMIKSSARLIATSHENLERKVVEGSFREDLFYKLSVMPIFLPPLRERQDDIAGIAQSFIRRFSKTYGRSIVGLSEEALTLMRAYPWPGNLREFESVIERAFIVENSPLITKNSLSPHILEHIDKQGPRVVLEENYPMDYDAFKEQVEKEFIVNALRANRGRINQTVAAANIPKNTLLRKIKKYNIHIPRDL